MIFDFGPIAQFFDITAQYSNAVLIAILPHVTDFAQKLELRPAAEFTTNSVRRLFINPTKGDVQGSIEFSNGWDFGFQHGRISGFTAPHAFTTEQDPDRIPTYYGPVRMQKAEAVAFARTNLTRLGYSLEPVFADLEPNITLPEKVGKNVIPIYEIKWPDPRGGNAAEMEVNANERVLKKLRLSGNNLWRTPFQIPSSLPPARIIRAPAFIRSEPIPNTATSYSRSSCNQ